MCAAVVAAAPEKNKVTIGKISDVPQGTQPSPSAAATAVIPLVAVWRDANCLSFARLCLASNTMAAMATPCKSEIRIMRKPALVVNASRANAAISWPISASLSTIGSEDRKSGP